MKKVVVALLALVAFVLLLGAGRQTERVGAATPGSTIKPLLSCPDVDGSGGIRISDVTKVVLQYGNDRFLDPPTNSIPNPNYRFIYDINANGVLRVNDISLVVAQYGNDNPPAGTCPLVDTQVAKATLWALANAPATENEAALEAIGYYQASFDVPGQGVHYAKLENWDGVFDPAAPEGLVYNNGRLAAQLYVVDGTDVGWGTHEATSWPPPPVPHDVDLEGDADGPQCATACSWNGTYDGWHLHYYLCTTDVGTSSASALPGFQTASDCASYGGGDPLCTVPITTTPCYRWGQNVGWMGHLWNHEPNPNLIPDQGGDNGRFADCIPDGSTWKAFTCPA